MTNTPTIVLSVVLASAAAAGVSFAMRAPSSLPPTDANADLQREITDLRSLCTSLKDQLEQVRSAPKPASVAASERVAATVTDEQVAAAVESFLKKRGQKGAPNAAVADASNGATTDREAAVAQDYAAVVGTSYWSASDAWKKAFAAGRLKEVLAKFEQAAKDNPNDPQAQMNLANAYLASVQLDPGDYSDSRRADATLDRVLALDDHHWEARFTKAVSYTFWPDFLGKKKEAIAHFQTLVKQQETMPVSDDQAATYLYLGNLLEQSDPAKAKEYFQQGARRHPNNAELRAKAGS